MSRPESSEDLLLQVLLNLSQELWVLKDRQMVLEKLLAESGIKAAKALDGWQPDAAAKKVLDAERQAVEVAAALDPDQADFSALVPNRKGYEMARAAGMRSVALVLSATETMNRRNINMGLDQAAAVCRETVQQARSDGLKARAYISVAFACPYEGTVQDVEVERLAGDMFAAGAEEVIVADTIGAGNPARAKALFGRMAAAFGAERLAAHLHDTRALALANAWQALECGVRKFDASAGGLGGCPFAPGAAGNLATEDLVSMLHQAGFQTGIDLPALLDVVFGMEPMLGRPVGGRSLPWLRRRLAED